ANGDQLGVVPVEEGIRRAEEAGLDLVEVAPEATPPVCRVMDFGKYIYSLDKKEKEAKKKQKVFDVKEIKIGLKIDEHDYQTKLRNAVRFLTRGDKVKFTMIFRGREMAHVDLGQRVIARLVLDLEEYGEVEKNMGLEGNAMVLLFAPAVKKVK
ncbi:MAG: translation initiation factor IF-3, partial [Candidatus Omnitrophica bacterium]|nr:translation initiation factor IF-3 [Candidatus Omnitrophota bacterium]